MKVHVVNEKQNNFLKRKEIVAEIEHENEATPATAALQEYLAKEMKTDSDKIEVKSIFTDAGLPKSRAKIFVWEEKIAKKEKKQKTEEKKEAKEQTKEEKPKEKQEAKVQAKEEQKEVKERAEERADDAK